MTYDHFLNGKENILNGITEELNIDLETKEEERIKKDKSEEPIPKMILFPVEPSIEKKERKTKEASP